MSAISHCDEETLSFEGHPFRNTSPSLNLFSALNHLTSLLHVWIYPLRHRKHPDTQHYKLSSWRHVWAMIRVEMKPAVSDVRLPVALSLCSDWCRSDSVCCFGIKNDTCSHFCPCHWNWLLAKCQTQIFVYGLGRTDVSRSLFIYSSTITTLLKSRGRPTVSARLHERPALWIQSGHRGTVIFQLFSMNASKEHRKQKKHKQVKRVNWQQPHQCTVSAGNGLLNNWHPTSSLEPSCENSLKTRLC